MLNQLGHGYSASRIEEYETAIAERFLASVGPDGVFVPSNIDRTRPVVFCWDNNDLMEETATGEGTTHCTNGISSSGAAQQKVHHHDMTEPDIPHPMSHGYFLANQRAWILSAIKIILRTRASTDMA